MVHPASGRDLELILPAANTDWTAAAPAEFARWADPQGRKLLVLLVGNAGWHMARALAVPANVVLRPLPLGTPELRPAEPLRPLVREVVAGQGLRRTGGDADPAGRAVPVADRPPGGRAQGGRLPLGGRA